MFGVQQDTFDELRDFSVHGDGERRSGCRGHAPEDEQDLPAEDRIAQHVEHLSQKINLSLRRNGRLRKLSIIIPHASRASVSLTPRTKIGERPITRLSLGNVNVVLKGMLTYFFIVL